MERRSTPRIAPKSSTREKVLEHLFVGDLLRCLWRRGGRDVEVLRAEVDKGGYDIVLEANDVIRHVQLKSSHRTAATSEVGINIALDASRAAASSGSSSIPTPCSSARSCGSVVCPARRYRSLGDRVGKHSKGDSAGVKALRPNIRILRRGRFESLATIDDVAQMLFGITAVHAGPH